MKIRLYDTEYDFDDELTIREARVLKEHGLTIRGFFSMLALSDPDAITGLAFLCKQRAGEHPKWSDFDDMSYDDIEIAFEDDDEDESGEGDAVDPQLSSTGSDSGTTPGEGSSST